MTSLHFPRPPLADFRPYDPLQQLTYAFVVFVLATAIREANISPYLWVNGAPPHGEESPEFAALARDEFRDRHLEVGGLVRRPLSPPMNSTPRRCRWSTERPCVCVWRRSSATRW